MARRVVMGQQNDGTYGLRVSAAGVDAFVGTGQGGDFTFNSDWTDMSKILLVGRLNWAVNGFYTGTSNGFGCVFADQGYLPFIEVRRGVGSIVYDDWNPQRDPPNGAGIAPWGNPGYTAIRTAFGLQESGSTTHFLLVLVMKIAVPVEFG
jgi:hypothetical protein